jgi:hypothetical protein
MHEERDDLEYGRRMLAPLAGEPAGPSTVDIRRAIADGRRRLRTRAVAGVSAVAAVTALVVAGVPAALAARDSRDPSVAPPAATAPVPAPVPAPSPIPPPTRAPEPEPPSECVLRELPVPEDAYQSLVTGADPTGRFILGRSYAEAGPDGSNRNAGTRMQVLIWDDGEPVAVDIPGEDPALHDVNSSGVAVGLSYVSGDRATYWVYEDGVLTALPEGSSVASVNEQGRLAGAVTVAGGRNVPAVWRSPSDPPEQLSAPGDAWDVHATAVDTDGTVVGTGYDEDRPSHVRTFVWRPDGTRQELPLPEVETGTVTGFSADVIRDGMVVGQAERELPDGAVDFPAFRYDLRTGGYTGLSTPVHIGVQALSARGWMAGGTVDGPVLLAGSTLVPLPYPELPEDLGDRFGNAPIVTTISDDGRTMSGQIQTEDGEASAAVWRCR